MILFDVAKINSRIEEIDNESLKDNFWNSRKEAQKIIDEKNSLIYKRDLFLNIKKSYAEITELLNTISPQDIEMLDLICTEYVELSKKTSELQKMLLFSGQYDSSNCYLDIHPGAGGTEACDWANMLLRMYTRFCERHGFIYKVCDFEPGEETGVKSVTILISGKNAYGLLKSEKGVHRLVRISPFDSNARRHTSFASVNVVPEMDENCSIDIKESDLKIDTYRSSGAGGQNVNKVETAVRITHIPTNIVVSCQIDRTQLKNREIAMNMLKSKLFELELQKQKEKIDSIIGIKKNIEWGNQIRSYVFCPYTLVKDTRTELEKTQIDKVMDGEIDDFLYSYLEMEARNK